MNFRCPHCERKSIPAAHKFGTTPATPAQCVLCGKYSSEPVGGRVLSILFSAVLPIPVIYYALTISKLWPVYTYFGVAIASGAAWFVLMPLRPVTDEIHKREYKLRRAIWIALGVLVVVSIILSFRIE